MIFLIQSQEQGCLGPPNCHMAEGGPHYGLSPVVASIFLVAQTAKCLPTMWETQVRSLGQEDPLEKGMATHSSILAGEFHGQRSLVGYSPWGRRVGHD